MRRIVSWLTEWSYRKAWIVSLVVVLIVAFGVMTITRVKQELIPDIEFPVATVIVQSPGQQPEQIANNLVAPIENATSTLDGLKATESTSVSEFGIILYNFEFGTSTADAKDAIQQELNDLRFGLALVPAC